MEVIAAQNITRKYSTGHGINNISLSVYTGQCFGILGANGSGKTTLTRLIAGLDRVQQGQLSVLGYSRIPLPTDIRRRCGVALDTPAHWHSLSGRQNLTFLARQYGLTGAVLKQRVDHLLDEAGLSAQDDEPVSTYSFGMRRKLNIIQALVHTPDLLILDEPSAALDMAFLEKLALWIQQRCQDGLTTWIADNDTDWLAKTATDVVLLDQGRIAASGNVNELMDSFDARYRITIELENTIAIASSSLDGIIRFHQDKKQICADVNSNPRLPTHLLEWITSVGGRVRSMEVRSITLHEALHQRAVQREVSV